MKTILILMPIGVPGRRSLGCDGDCAEADIHPVREHPSGVAGEGELCQPAQGICLRHLRERETGARF